MFETTLFAAVCDERVEHESLDVFGNEYRYVLDEENFATIVRCVACTEEVRVPALIDGFAVRAIGEEAFASSGKLSALVRPLAQGRNDLRSSQTYLDLRGRGCNAQLRRILLPEGVVAIGRAAFRGCNRLEEVVLPESLEEIGELAFSCTAVKSVRLGRLCTRLADDALRTGPETLPGVNGSYRSKLEQVEVAPGNPRYCMQGGMLCRREHDGSLTALFCPGIANTVELDGNLVRIDRRAFEGTFEIGEARVCDAVLFDESVGLFAQATCTRLVVLASEAAGEDPRVALTLNMPDRALSRCVLATTSAGRIDVRALAAAYDDALGSVEDRLDRACLMAARLALPSYLDEHHRSSFEAAVNRDFDVIVAQLGARGRWDQIEQLVDAGILTGETVSRAVEVLGKLSDAAAVGFVLELKHRRLEQDVWDYGL